MIIHGAILSPFVAKTMAFAAEKGLEVTNRPAMPGSSDPAFRAMSPFGKVPAFEDGDYKLSDSSAIIAYLEAKYPVPALIPAEPEARGRAIWFDEFADTILGAAVGAIFFNRIVASRFMGREGDLAAADAAEKNSVPPILDYLEGQLAGQEFLLGSLSLADIAVAVLFINLGYGGVTPDAGTYPNLTAFLARMHARPSIAPIIAQGRGFLGL